VSSGEPSPSRQKLLFAGTNDLVWSRAARGVRNLIAKGETREAVEHAKRLHKDSPTSASESLLVEAYSARIGTLEERGLPVEAQALRDLVSQRFSRSVSAPESAPVVPPKTDSALEELLRPLNEPELLPERAAGASLLRRGKAVTGTDDALHCPVCRARFRQSPECPRCGADLRPLMRLAAASRLVRSRASDALREGDLERARALAAQAEALHATASGWRLRVLLEAASVVVGRPTQDRQPRVHPLQSSR
jgi:hypothetical protein